MEVQKEEDFEKEWTSVDIPNYKLDEIMKEVNLLKNIVIDISKTVSIQTENFNKSIDNIENINHRMTLIVDKLEHINIPQQQEYTTYSYFKSYILPIAGVLGFNLPILIMFGVKTGLFTLPINFLLRYKLSRDMMYNIFRYLI